ncbi:MULTISPECIES: hypothetical protein [Bacillus]|nr:MULTISPECIES: hypothetical protein [Bacillus]
MKLFVIMSKYLPLWIVMVALIAYFFPQTFTSICLSNKETA